MADVVWTVRGEAQRYARGTVEVQRYQHRAKVAFSSIRTRVEYGLVVSHHYTWNPCDAKDIIEFGDIRVTD